MMARMDLSFFSMMRKIAKVWRNIFLTDMTFFNAFVFNFMKLKDTEVERYRDDREETTRTINCLKINLI